MSSSISQCKNEIIMAMHFLLKEKIQLKKDYVKYYHDLVDETDTFDNGIKYMQKTRSLPDSVIKLKQLA